MDTWLSLENLWEQETVVRCLPEPVRRVVGDLSDREQTLVGLESLR